MLLDVPRPFGGFRGHPTTLLPSHSRLLAAEGRPMLQTVIHPPPHAPSVLPIAPPARAPRNAFDTLRSQFAGLDALCRRLAQAGRGSPGWTPSTVLSRGAISGAEVTRFWLDAQGRLDGSHGSVEGERAARAHLALIHAYTNYELHGRRTFWVEDGLAWMLSNTNLDIEGGFLNLPFPTCAFVFTDRTTCRLADRLLSVGESGSTVRLEPPIKAATVCLIQGPASQDPRPLRMTCLFDELNGSAPIVVIRDLEIRKTDRLDGILDGQVTGYRNPVYTSPEMRQFTLLVINAVLHSTSVGVVPTLIAAARLPPSAPLESGRRGRTARRERARQTQKGTQEDVLFLSGRIDVRQLEKMQRAEQGEGGFQLMVRFRVRGHWRRAAATWSDQRLRWIQPFWKGPDMATVIRREYQLRQ